jgi:hypothetical protein
MAEAQTLQPGSQVCATHCFAVLSSVAAPGKTVCIYVCMYMHALHLHPRACARTRVDKFVIPYVRTHQQFAQKVLSLFSRNHCCSLRHHHSLFLDAFPLCSARTAHGQLRRRRCTWRNNLIFVVWSSLGQAGCRTVWRRFVCVCVCVCVWSFSPQE